MEDILSDFPNIRVQKQLPSYVKIFVPNPPQNAMFLHRISLNSSPRLEDSHAEDSALNCTSSSDLDVTGSPLEPTMYSLQLDETVFNVKKCWSDEEENHIPLSLKNARIIVSRYIMKVPTCNIPLWVVCNGQDTSKTLLLCGFKKDGWCSRTTVSYEGQYPLSVLEEEEELTGFGANLEIEPVDSNVSCVFSLYEGTDFDRTLQDTYIKSSMQNCSKMLVELKWHHASLKVPAEGVSAVLTMDLNIGHISSSIYPLWRQWNFLLKYYEMLCHVNLNKNYMPPDNNSPTELSLENILKKILSLINNPECIVESLSWEPVVNDFQHGKSNENILTILVKQVADCTRPDCDVIDKIWLILNEINDISSLTDCLNNMLSELGEAKSRTHANIGKNTVLANIISAHLKRELAVTEVSVKKTLEIMIEAGIEKLKQDYIYIFKKLDIECSSFFKNISTSFTKSLEIVKYNMNLLAQLHVSLDFILAAQFYFDMTRQRISQFAQNVFDKCCQKIVSFDTMQSNTLVSLEVPVNFECVSDHLPNDFLNYKLVKSSKDENIKDYSLLLLSSLPIFPPSILQPGTENPQGENENTFVEQQYHVYKLSCWCDYVEKL